MRICEAHRSHSFLVLFAKILLQFVSLFEHRFKHPFKENIESQSWYPATPWISLCEAPALAHLSKGTCKTPPSCGMPTSGRHDDRSPVGEHRRGRKRRNRNNAYELGTAAIQCLDSSDSTRCVCFCSRITPRCQTITTLYTCTVDEFLI